MWRTRLAQNSKTRLLYIGSAEILEQTHHLPTRTRRTATNLRFNLVDQNKIFTMTRKSLERHYETTDYKMSGHLKKLQKEQTEFLETFDGHLADVKIHLDRKKTVPEEKPYQCFFRRTMILQKTDSSRGNSCRQSTWKASMATPNGNWAKRRRHSNGWLNKYQSLEKLKDIPTAFLTNWKTPCSSKKCRKNENRFIEKQKK